MNFRWLKKSRTYLPLRLFIFYLVVSLAGFREHSAELLDLIAREKSLKDLGALRGSFRWDLVQDLSEGIGLLLGKEAVARTQQDDEGKYTWSPESLLSHLLSPRAASPPSQDRCAVSG